MGTVWKGQVDFGIITIREDEFEAVLQRLPEKIETVSYQRRYRLRRLQLTPSEAYTIAVVRCAEQGNGEAHAAARDLLEDLDPAWLFVVGIGGGVPANEFSLGDVVVSTRIADFSVEAVLKDHSHEYALTGGPLHREAVKLAADIRGMVLDGELDGWNSPTAITLARPPVVLTDDKFYGDDDWRSEVREKLERHFQGQPSRPPLVTAGPIASSDRLIKDAEILQVWLKIARQIQVVEMESSGVYRAAHARDVPFLSIRGISDIVGYKRDSDWIAYACHTAAAFLLAFLRAGVIPPRTSKSAERSEGRQPLDHEVLQLPTTSSPPYQLRPPKVPQQLTTASAPYQLRPPVADFVGREQEIEKLSEAVRRNQQGGATVILRGIGGLGKTELAYAVAQHLAGEFPDGQLFLDMRGTSDTPLSAEQALQRVSQAFDIQAQVASEIDELLVRYRSELHGKRVLILADDARDAEQVRRLTPPTGCALLITTRERFILPGAEAFDLGVMSLDHAEELLLHICPRIGAAASRLARLSGLLPLALRVNASVLFNDPTKDVEAYLTALADERTQLTRDPTDRALDVEATLRVSYDSLGEAAQTTLRHISIFSSSFDIEAAKAVVDLGKVKMPASIETDGRRQKGRPAPPRLEDILSELYRHSLVDYDTATRRYTLHELVRTFGAQQMTSAERERFRRYAVYYSTIAAMAEALYQKGGEQTLQGLAMFDRERVHIDTALNWVRRNHDDDLLLIYAQTIGEIGSVRYHPRHEMIPLGEELLASARRRKRRDVEASMLNMLGNAHSTLGDARQATPLYTEALKLIRALRGQKRQRRAEASLIGNLGLCYRDLGDIQRAIELHDQSLAIARELGDRQGEASSLTNLGLCYQNLGDIQRAIELHDQSLAIARELGNRQGEARCLGNLGLCYQNRGYIQRAIELHDQSLAIERELGNRRGEASSLASLGSCYEDLGDIQRAIELHDQSLTIRRKLEDRQGEANSLGSLGSCYRALGDIQRAIELHDQSLAIERELGNRRGEATSLGNLGLCYTYLGETQRAIELGEETLRIARELGMQPLEGYALRCLGMAYAASGNVEQAIEAQEQALVIARTVEDPKLEGRSLNHLGEVYLQLGDKQQATAHLEQALSIMKKIGDRRYEAICSWNLGEALVQQGHLSQAAALMQVRVDFERGIGHALLEEHSRRLLEVRERMQNEG